MKILWMLLMLAILTACTPTAKESEKHKDLPEPKNLKSDQSDPKETKEQDPNWGYEPLSPSESQKRSMKVRDFAEKSMNKDFPDTGYPDYYGGMYFNESDERLHLLLTDLDRQEDLDQYIIDWEGILFAVDEVRYSYRDLLELSAALTEADLFDEPSEVDMERNLVAIHWWSKGAIAKKELYEALHESNIISEKLLDELSKEGEIDAESLQSMIEEEPIYIDRSERDPQ